MQSQYSDSNRERALMTLESISETIEQLIEWNSHVNSVETYYSSQTGMQLLAANCTLITAIGEGVNRINHIIPNFLSNNFSDIPWKSIIGMRNQIAHGYFELDADIVYEAVKNDIPPLHQVIDKAIILLKSYDNDF